MTPLTHEEVAPWLRLTLVPGVSAAVQQGLLRRFGSPEGVLASAGQAIASFAGNDVAEALQRGPAPALLESTLRWLETPGHHLLALGDEAYPPALLNISDPPTVIYAMGRLELLRSPCLGIVGSRNSTPQGMRDARAFARTLSDAGLCIVSGLALGIDAAAHEGGLEGGGSSIAVTGTGADIVYPARNRELAHRLARQGCVITEFALGTPAARENFPRRNRLISGLSRGVLVVEAAELSGSLITARYAVEQDRDVFAIPGSIHSTLSKGCHKLIKQGAKLVENAGDVLAELGMQAPSGSGEALAAARLAPHPLLEAMGHAPISVDQMASRTGLAASDIAAQLCQLEIDGRISVLAGGWFQRLEGA